MLNQLPTVYKALSGDADGKPGGGGGAKKKARAPGSRGARGSLDFRTRRRRARSPAACADAAREAARALTRPPPRRTPRGVVQQAVAPPPGAKRERTDPEVRFCASAPRRTRPPPRAPRSRSRVHASRRPPRAQCYDKPSPGRILSPKDNLNLLQGATIEVRRPRRRGDAPLAPCRWCTAAAPPPARRHAGTHRSLAVQFFPGPPLFMLSCTDAVPAAAAAPSQLYWPDDGLWYRAEILSLNPRGRSAKARRGARAGRAASGENSKRRKSSRPCAALWTDTDAPPCRRPAPAGAVQHWRRGAAVAG
jgi:hypothetical protein